MGYLILIIITFLLTSTYEYLIIEACNDKYLLKMLILLYRLMRFETEKSS